MARPAQPRLCKILTPRQETGDYYLFSNVPYAEQPTGHLRFQRVSLPTANSSTMNNGSSDVICMQAYPEWIVQLQAEAYGVSVDVMTQILYAESGQTEACLVLDVYVPAAVFDGNATSKGIHMISHSPFTLYQTHGLTDTGQKLAPVLLWMHGGGFTYGSKTSTGSPAGIIARSNLNESEGIIFVSINYRLGMFGWLAGSDVTPNLGLYDQRVALDWVQEYIGLFGGDADQVTIIGESAGAASAVHHITAYGGNDTLPFQQAIVQSPAFQFNLNQTLAYDLTMEQATNRTGTSIRDVTELSALDSDTLYAINFYVVYSASTGNFIYGVSPDGTYVPDYPQVLLAEGRFNHDVKVLPAHNSLEAAPFVDSSISTEADLVAQLQANYPEVSNATLNAILALYPLADYENSQFLRGVQIASDAFFSCTTRYLALAFDNNTYNYLFSYPPGYHAEDTSYTFFNGDTSTSDDGYPVDVDLAYALQDYIVGFTMSGNPNASPAGTTLEFPVYGSNATVLELAFNGLLTTVDDLKNDRCPWWQQAIIDGLV